MKIEVGDTVQLMGSVLVKLRKDAPDVYEKIMDMGRVGGQVMAMNHEIISIDFGKPGQPPVTVEIEHKNHHLTLQLVRKANGSLVSPQVDQPVQSQHPVRSASMTAQLGAMPSFMGQLVHPQQQQQLQEEEGSPSPKIRMAQWVMMQFIGLKQYAISQDLVRRDDDSSPSPNPTGENWKKKDFRAVVIELSDGEEQLYATALKQIQDWISSDSVKPVKLHPEITMPDAILDDDDLDAKYADESAG